VVIVPTYDERANIERLLQGALAQDPRIDVLVVDDASPDGTGAIVDAYAARDGRVHALHRAGKLGLGTAYLDGFRWALDRDYDAVFEMDADFSHDPGHLPTFLEAIEDVDIVLGSRYRNGKVTVINWPISRLILSYGANLYARAVTGLPLFDATGGFKCFRRAVLESIDLSRVRSNGYAFQIEMSFRAWKNGFRIREIPIVFHDRTEGESKMSRQIIREAIWMVWRLRWLSITGRL
jgi:dolichol-phosphate mannosyltransferase